MSSLVELALAERDYKNAGVSFFFFFFAGGNQVGGGGYFLIRGCGCAAGWDRIFTTGLTIMGSHFH